MPDGPEKPESPDGQPPMEQLDELQEHEDELTPKQRFERITRIALLLGYDLMDKLRYWEKETSKLSDKQIAKRLPPLTASVEKLREAYLSFSDLEL
jgi:hypothetical protein